MKVDDSELRVLGIDPGLTRMGYGVVEEAGGRMQALACGTLRTSPELPTSARLAELFDRLRQVLRELRPEAVACERLFFAANAASAVPAIQSSGVALLLAAQAGLPVHEYTPLQVKQAVVGRGSATKKQVQYMVERQVGEVRPDSADAADALAVAVTHLASRRLAGIGVR